MRTLIVIAALAALAAAPCATRQQVYGPAAPSTSLYGACVLHEAGWDRYLMYFTADSGVVGGRPTYVLPGQAGDAGTYNTACGTWYADRIWLTWSFSDGKGRWDRNDGYGNVPPFLAIAPGGAGESALVGDPAVVYWNGQWHLYYEGTDRCDGLGNRIFQAVATSWFGPWRKLGPVQGLPEPTDPVGQAWPTVMTDGAVLYVYFADGVRLRAATATDPFGQALSVLPDTVISDYVNRAQVVKLAADHYRLTYDNFGNTEIRQADSCSPVAFDSGARILGGNVSRPCYLPKERRVYFSDGGSTIGLLTLPNW